MKVKVTYTVDYNDVPGLVKKLQLILSIIENNFEILQLISSQYNIFTRIDS